MNALELGKETAIGDTSKNLDFSEQKKRERTVYGATPEKIADAVRHLLCQLHNESGDDVVNRFMSVVTHPEWKIACHVVREQGLNTVTGAINSVANDVDAEMANTGFQAVWVPNPSNPNAKV